MARGSGLISYQDKQQLKDNIMKKINWIKLLLFFFPSYFYKKNYRVIEMNPVYDSIHGEGKGWICVTNEIAKFDADLMCFILNHQSIYTHKVVKTKG